MDAFVDRLVVPERIGELFARATGLSLNSRALAWRPFRYLVWRIGHLVALRDSATIVLGPSDRQRLQGLTQWVDLLVSLVHEFKEAGAEVITWPVLGAKLKAMTLDGVPQTATTEPYAFIVTLRVLPRLLSKVARPKNAGAIACPLTGLIFRAMSEYAPTQHFDLGVIVALYKQKNAALLVFFMEIWVLYRLRAYDGEMPVLADAERRRLVYLWRHRHSPVGQSIFLHALEALQYLFCDDATTLLRTSAQIVSRYREVMTRLQEEVGAPSSRWRLAPIQSEHLREALRRWVLFVWDQTPFLAEYAGQVSPARLARLSQTRYSANLSHALTMESCAFSGDVLPVLFYPFLDALVDSRRVQSCNPAAVCTPELLQSKAGVIRALVGGAIRNALRNSRALVSPKAQRDIFSLALHKLGVSGADDILHSYFSETSSLNQTDEAAGALKSASPADFGLLVTLAREWRDAALIQSTPLLSRPALRAQKAAVKWRFATYPRPPDKHDQLVFCGVCKQIKSIAVDFITSTRIGDARHVAGCSHVVIHRGEVCCGRTKGQCALICGSTPVTRVHVAGKQVVYGGRLYMLCGSCGLTCVADELATYSGGCILCQVCVRNRRKKKIAIREQKEKESAKFQKELRRAQYFTNRMKPSAPRVREARTKKQQQIRNRRREKILRGRRIGRGTSVKRIPKKRKKSSA